MKTLITTLAVLSGALCFSAPRPPAHFGPRPAPHVFHRPPPHPQPWHPHPHHHHHYNAWPVFAGTLLGTTVAEIIRPSPPTIVVQSSPVVVQPVVASPVVQKVWVPGYWQETRNANGVVISRTWVPGYWRYE